MSRRKLVSLQLQRFKNISEFAFHNCPFYQNLYRRAGINEKNIRHAKIEDFPVINKLMMMDHFDQIVTDPQLEYKKLKKYIKTNTDPHDTYLQNYKIFRTSGTTGEPGIFPISIKEMGRVLGAMLSRVETINPKNILRKKKIAYIAIVDGHFIGVSYLLNIPKLTMEVKVFSILDPLPEMIQALNAYQPDELTGYASSMEILAEEQIRGNLKIHPQKIICGGDRLFPLRRKKIHKAFNTNPLDSYSMTEGFGVASELPGEHELRVFDDLYLLETKPKTHITNLYNHTFPIIRYESGDVIKLSKKQNYRRYPFTRLEKIQGRESDFLEIIDNKGEIDSLHPEMLEEFHVQGLKKCQFCKQPNNTILLRIVGMGNDMKKQAQKVMREILKQKNADKAVKIEIEITDKIDVDSKTGKFRLIRREEARS